MPIWSPFTVPVSTVVTVSPIGISSGGVAVKNNGANFGPDTVGTTTSGIQEALNSLPTVTVVNSNNQFVSGRVGTIQLLVGAFLCTSRITIPPGIISLIGAGSSGWRTSSGYTYGQNNAGTTIYSTANGSLQGTIAVPVDGNGFPATALHLEGMDLITQSPATAALGFNSSIVLSLPGWQTGEIIDVIGVELTAAGVIGNNTWKIIDASPGAQGGFRIMRNVQGFGGNEGVVINCAGISCDNVGGAFQGSSGTITINRGVHIYQNLHQVFRNMYGGTVNYGLGVDFYATGQPFTPLIIDGFSWEATSHYIFFFGGPTGTLIINKPDWESGTNPQTDIAAALAAGGSTYSLTARTGVAVITHDEQDPQTGFAGARHVTVPAGPLTAGASPYTFPVQPFDAIYVLTTLGGMTALTLDGISVLQPTPANQVGIPIFVGRQKSLIATWATTAPVFQVLPI